MKHLHFSFFFPKELEQTWRICSFGCNNEWPFDNIDCYVDEIWIRTDDKSKFIIEKAFIIYKRPINILLQYKRTLHNHHLATRASTTIKTAHRRSILWSYDRMDEPGQFVKTLQVIASNRVDKLYLKNLIIEQVSRLNDVLKNWNDVLKLFRLIKYLQMLHYV